MILDTNPHTGEITLLYFTRHGEYTEPLMTTEVYGRDDEAAIVMGDRVRVHEMWNFHTLVDSIMFWQKLRRGKDMSIDEALGRAYATIDGAMPGLLEEFGLEDGDWGEFIILEGTLQGCVRAARRHLEAVDKEPSGDDDTFDYWPDAMRMAYGLCEDLDSDRRFGLMDDYDRIRDTHFPDEWADEIDIPCNTNA